MALPYSKYDQMRVRNKGYSGGYYAIPIFWLSASKIPPKTPITQRSNNGDILYAPLVCYMKTGSSYWDNLVILLIRAQTLIENNCVWCKINQATNSQGGRNYSITTSDFVNAISNGWSSDYVAEEITQTRFNTVQEKIDFSKQFTTREYWRRTLLTYYANYNVTETLVDTLLDNSIACIITQNYPEMMLGDAYNWYGILSRSGSGGGGYPINGYVDQILTFCKIDGSKTCVRSFIHTNNSYANFYGSPSICVQDMSIALGDISDSNLHPVNLGNCLTGPQDSLAQATGFTTAYDNLGSVFAKRDVPEQDISGALDFTGSISVKDPYSNIDVATKGYTSKILNSKNILNSIVLRSQ